MQNRPHLQTKNSISNDIDEAPQNLRPGRGVSSMGLNNNSMNSASLQNHYQGNNNSKLFAQSSISNEMMRKNVMNDILRYNIDAVESNFNSNTNSI